MHQIFHPMKPFSFQDLQNHDLDTVRALAVEQSQLLVVATGVIRKLETIVENLTKELGAQNQKTLFAAQSLEKLRQLHFGRKSERREDPSDESPLFSLFTQLNTNSDIASTEEKLSKSDNPNPKKKPY